MTREVLVREGRNVLVVVGGGRADGWWEKELDRRDWRGIGGAAGWAVKVAVGGGADDWVVRG
jgi:hypothetical protein